MTEHAIRDAAESSSAQRIRLIENTATVRGRLLKRRRKCLAWQAGSRFPNGEASLQRRRRDVDGTSQMPEPGANWPDLS
jgi:hypothetical protein